MRTRIKICCIASAEEAGLAIDAGADALGFVCARPTSVRTIDEAAVAAIATQVPPPIATFVLTTERSADAIAAQVRRTRASTVQVLPHLDPAEHARLGELEPHIRRVQVVHVEGPAALEMIPAYGPHVHAFLLDSGRPSAAVPEYGGTGRAHDWDISAAFVAASPRPVFLAGGLHHGNVGEAIRRVRPFGVDLCSSVRTENRLDPAKLAAFVAAVRAAE